MRLEKCIKQVTKIVSPLLFRTAPEPGWTEARDGGLIPEFLYRFYCLAGYFSLDRAPRFLNDSDRMLFSFLEGLTRGIQESLEEAHELVIQIHTYQKTGYSPLKEGRGEEWDPKADMRGKRSFRHLIVCLAGALDQLSEIVSIFFHGDIQSLTVGRASSLTLRNLARTPFIPSGAIVSLKQARFQDLHTVLRQEIEATGEEQDWLDLFYLYRNKLAHLGAPMFPIFCLPDTEEEFYHFAPNQWPLFHQTHIRPAVESRNDPGALQRYVDGSYVHQDLGQYADGLIKRVERLLNGCFKVLCRVYTEFADLELNKGALQSLRKKRKQYAFKAFVE